MKVEILESNLKGVTFGKAIGSGGNSLLFEVFIEADAVCIMFVVNIGGVEYEFPLFEYGMGDDLFEFDFFLIFQQKSMGVEEHIFVAVDDKVMRVTMRKMRKLRHELIEEFLFFKIGVSLLSTDERPTSHNDFG